jgi:uncharacterized protein YecT (DUF1311 family)
VHIRVSILATAIVLIASSSLHAEQVCGDLTNQTEMNVCAGKAFEKSDAELNKLFKQTEGRLKDDADTTKLLITAQRAWVSFRDAECAFSSSMVAQGSVYPFVKNSCLEGLTQSRIKDLKVYLSCEEGDMSCPVPAAQ